MENTPCPPNPGVIVSIQGVQGGVMVSGVENCLPPIYEVVGEGSGLIMSKEILP